MEIVSFGEWVQDRRNQLGYTRKRFADLVGCAPITIKKIEKDERRPSAEMAELLATHLQIPEVEQEDFVRRARGEFVPSLRAPREMSLTEAQAAPMPEETPKHNLPAQTTSFVGRQAELNEISDNLANPGCRLLTILGAGGMGKTRLGIEVAEAHLETFSDGIVYVPLAPVSPDSGTSRLTPPLAALTDALGITLQGQAPPATQLQNYLRRKELLIVFDNFEHLLETAVSLPPLLARAPDVKILVTSRERLDLQEEWLYPLQGLAYQQGGKAIELFVQRARQVSHRFDPQLEADAIQHICQLVEGMPLGLELAASWVSQLSCAEIAVEIEHEIDFLETTMRNVPTRHRSLRAVFAHTWQRLTEAEQSVLMKIAVFRGGFERDAAKVVADATLRQLSTLVNKSLLRRSQSGRYEIHELLRQFAEEKGKSLVDFDRSLQKRHGQYYLNLFAAQEIYVFGTYTGDRSLSGLHTIVRDIDNVRTAWLWGIDQKQFQLIFKATVTMLTFFEDRGWILEGLEWSQKTLQSAQATCHNGHPQIACLVLAYHLSITGWFQGRLGNYQLAIQETEAALPLLTDNAYEANLIRWHYHLSIGNAFLNQGDVLPALESARKMLAAAEVLGITVLHTLALDFCGEVLYAQGAYTAAKEMADKSRQLVGTIRNPKGTIYNRRNLAKIAAANGQFEEAVMHFQHGVALSEAMNERMQQVNILFEMGTTMILQEEFDAAQTYLEKALSVATEMNKTNGIADALWGLGNLSARQGAYDAARHYFQRSEATITLNLWPSGGRGWVDLALGDLTEASAFFVNRLQTSRQFHQAPIALDTIAGMAHVLAGTGKLTEALELIGLLQAHPATLYESRMRVEALTSELIAELGTDVVEAALARGRELDLWQTAVLLLTR